MAEPSVNLKIKAIDDTKKAFASIGKSVASLTAIAGTAIGIVGGIFTGKSVQAAIEQENAINDLNSSLEQTGKFSLQASKDLQDFASQLQETSKFGDEVILRNAALIQSYGDLDSEGLKRATQAAADFAAATNKDIGTASEVIAKAASGSVEAFSRYGIRIQKTGDQAKDFALVLDQLESKFGGRAQAQIKTFGGATAQLGNTFGDLLEKFGDLVIKNPIIIDSISTINTGLIELQKIVIDNKKVLTNLVTSAFKSIISGAGFVAKSILSIAETFIVLNKKIQTFFNQNDSVYKKALKERDDLLQEYFEKAGTAEEASIKKRLDAANNYLEGIEKSNEKEQSLYDNKISILDEFKNKIDEIQNKITQSKAIEIEVKTKTTVDAAISKTFFESVNEKFDELGVAIGKSLKNNSKKLAIDFAQLSLGGAEGAKKLLGNLSSFVGETFLGPAGAALGPIVEELSKGPDAVREQVRAFAQAIPILIENIIAAIPVFIEEITIGLSRAFVVLAERADVIAINFAKALIAASPTIAIELGKAFAFELPIALAQATPKIAENFIENLAKAVPRFIDELIRELKNKIGSAFKGITGGAGDIFSDVIGGIGGFVSGIGGKLGFAQGGQVIKVPTGFPNDSFPARLTSEELVIDRSLTSRLENFLDNGQQQSRGITDALLAQILSELRKETKVETSINIDQRTFADIILELSRNNARLAV
jgi:hypothetical protein